MVGNIAASHITFSDSAVAGTTQVTVKSILFSEKASANVNINDTIPLKKTITITAENGSTKNYVMSINVSTATTTGDGMTMTGTPMTTTGDGMTMTGSSVVPVVIGTITGARLAIASITGSEVTISGNFTKLNNPFITEMGILVTTDAMLNLELNNDNQAPMGATKYPAAATLLQRINNPVNTDITFSIPVTNLQTGTSHYFRGYVIIGENILYANTLNAATPVGKVSVSDFNISLPYNVAGMNSDGYFRINYNKDPFPIRSFGMLITSGNGITLALNGENAPAGARLIRGNATAIAAANASTNGTLTLSAASLGLEITYTYRGYVRNDAGITYTPIASKTTPGTTTLIPDDNFRNAILSCINTNGTTITFNTGGAMYPDQLAGLIECTESFDGTISSNGNRISTAALVSITRFNYGDFENRTRTQRNNKLDNQKIRSLSGVEQMVNLTHSNLENNFLSNLDITANTALTNININNNSLTSLNLFNNTALTTLNANNNSLTSLNLFNNTALTTLNANNNSLTSLNIAGSISLTTLNANNNSLTSLNIAGSISLTTLNANNNSLTSLDLSTNTALTDIFVSNNSLTSLNIAGSISLTTLNANNNSLTSLDLSTNTALTDIFVSNNSLTSLDLSTNTALTDIFVSNNSLTSLDLAANTTLFDIRLSNNSLTSLDLAANTALRALSVNNNTSLTCIRVNASQLVGQANALLVDKINTPANLSVNCP